jgi:uncharacterized cupin superfamily protein
MSTVIIQKLSRREIEERQIGKWPVWEKEVSRFEHEYEGEEECLFLEGEVVIETGEGIHCTWDVRKPVKKHYNFP